MQNHAEIVVIRYNNIDIMLTILLGPMWTNNVGSTSFYSSVQRYCQRLVRCQPNNPCICQRNAISSLLNNAFSQRQEFRVGAIFNTSEKFMIIALNFKSSYIFSMYFLPCIQTLDVLTSEELQSTNLYCCIINPTS